MMKQEYSTPEMELLFFIQRDVVTASGDVKTDIENPSDDWWNEL